MIPSAATGLPTQFNHHPFWFIDFKEQARIRKQNAGRVAAKAPETGQRFFMDFGFVRASLINYTKPNKLTDQMINSYDGFSAYLAVVDEHSRHIWVFLCKSKKPPVDLIFAFLLLHSRDAGGVVRCNKDGELAQSADF